jgi:hypothetical protein
MTRTLPIAIVVSLAAAPALAQTPVDPAHKMAWTENCGYVNWRDSGSPQGSQGVVSHGFFLSGYAWGENIGYLNFGDGVPAAGSAYGNTTGADHGVNIQPSGDLSGMAWGENVGWINFSTGSLGAQRARLEGSRLKGWAWGENIGWVNLDDANVYVAFGQACYANCDASTTAPILNVLDFICFQTKYAQADPYANCDGSTIAPVLNVLDFICFQTKYAQGCP